MGAAGLGGKASVRPTASCVRGRVGRSKPCARRRSPCARGSRGGACERACWVDRSASRSCLQIGAALTHAPGLAAPESGNEPGTNFAALSRRREACLCRGGRGKSIEGSGAQQFQTELLSSREVKGLSLHALSLLAVTVAVIGLDPAAPRALPFAHGPSRWRRHPRPALPRHPAR